MNKQLTTALVSSIILLSGCIDITDEDTPDAPDQKDNNLIYQDLTITEENTNSVSSLALESALNPILFSSSSEDDIPMVTGIVTVKDCKQSGTVTYSSSIEDALNQDSVTATFEDCDQGSSTLHGQVKLETSETSEQEVMMLTSKGITIEKRGYLLHLEELTSSRTLNNNRDTLSFDFDAKLTEEKIGGTITIDTIMPFVYQGNTSTVPYMGKMVVTGNAGANLVIEVIDTESVKITLDNDGDSLLDWEDTVSWQALGF